MCKRWYIKCIRSLSLPNNGPYLPDRETPSGTTYFASGPQFLNFTSSGFPLPLFVLLLNILDLLVLTFFLYPLSSFSFSFHVSQCLDLLVLKCYSIHYLCSFSPFLASKVLKSSGPHIFTFPMSLIIFSFILVVCLNCLDLLALIISLIWFILPGR